jgi:hypothetical protein
MTGARRVHPADGAVQSCVAEARLPVGAPLM